MQPKYIALVAFGKQPEKPFMLRLDRAGLAFVSFFDPGSASQEADFPSYKNAKHNTFGNMDISI
jgi:hypothetical protein